MLRRYMGQRFCAAFLAFAVVLALLPGSPVGLRATEAAADVEDAPQGGWCAGMAGSEENHASIRLRVDEPAEVGQVAVDEHGKIEINGILHKHADMVDVTEERVAAPEFTIGPPPDGVAAWASSWTTSMRPPHLGSNRLCARAERDPKRTARIQRSFTVVDLIPPSDVPGLTVGNVTATSATASWGAATDNYGLAGYEISVDGGAPHQISTGTRSHTVTGLAPLSRHTVSVVAVDLAGNKSETPATASFTTKEPPPPSDSDLALEVSQGGAVASWHPYLPPTASADATYRVFVDDEEIAEFPLDQHCTSAAGDPATPCTENDLVKYPVSELEEGTPHTFRVDALRADGTKGRDLNGSFTTTTGPYLVSPETTQTTATEASACTGRGGDIYIAASSRGSVPAPAGGTELFTGCYSVPDSTCIDTFRQSDNELLECSDDVTELLEDVAPPNRGPLLSSVDDLAGLTPGELRAKFFQPGVQPITWRLQGGCAVILEKAVEATATAEVAAGSSAAVSWLLVIGIGIVVGVVLGTIWAIIDATPIAIGGLLEYPIDHTTDFRTYEDWWLQEGEFFNSLKIYAETVKITKDLTGLYALPFAWTSEDDSRFRTTVDRACAAQQGHPTSPYAGCGDDFAVYVPGGTNYKFAPMKETGRHIVEAMGNGYPQPPQKPQWFWPARSVNGRAARSAGHGRRWFETAKFKPNACVGRPRGDVCDEFPFWRTNQAVDLTGIVASLKSVPAAEAVPQRDDINQFYRECKVKDTDRFIVLPVKPWVEANAPSFGFRVTPTGASVCMAPAKP